MSDIFILLLEQKWHNEGGYIYDIINIYDSEEKARNAMKTAWSSYLARNSWKRFSEHLDECLITCERYDLRFYLKRKPLL